MDIGAWHEFFAVTAAIAATLSGLVFVAVSINLMQIISVAGTSTLALESLTQLLGAMALGIVGVVPNQGPRLLCIETLTLTILLWIVQTRWQLEFFQQRAGRPWRWTANRFVRTQAACLPFFAAGCFLWFGKSIGLYFFVPGQLLSFLAGVANAWVLLVKIVRVRENEPICADHGESLGDLLND